MKKTKIVCTLGPACNNEPMLEKMLLSGMNVARLNFSHGTHDSHREAIERFRRVRDRLGMPAAVMLDTKGPEIRLGLFQEGGADVDEGATYTLTARPVTGDSTTASFSFAELPNRLQPGVLILIDDGHVAMRVKSIEDKDIHCVVEYGGHLSDHKSVNVPSVPLNIPYLSANDQSDLLFGIENDVDYIAASFVRCKEDMIALRKFIDYNGGRSIKIIAKIENGEGIAHFDEILQYADGIMIARGDMAVEIDYERLPGIQKRFIRRCYQAGKVVITATQMLESMIHEPNPTRAEITDVANAVFDGTSAVMLSGESAMGKYPDRAVKVMATIAERAEMDAFEMDAYRNIKHDLDYGDVTNAICDSAATTARDIKAKAIIVVTKRGNTARKMSKFRPAEPIVAATPMKKTYHQLSLSWGVYPVLSREQETTDELIAHAVDCARQISFVEDGDRVVVTLGVPLGISGSTNLIKVQVVGEMDT